MQALPRADNPPTLACLRFLGVSDSWNINGLYTLVYGLLYLCYYSVLPLLRSKAVSRTTKIRMYKTIIRPVVLYVSEAWCLTANDEKNLNIWGRKLLRKIFGPICVAGHLRSRTNEEVRQLYGELDIVTEIKKGRLRWMGHVERMSEEWVVKRLYQNTPEGSRSVGRPR